MMQGLLRLTALQQLYANDIGRGLAGETLSQIKPGDWPHLEKLTLLNNKLTDGDIGAIDGLKNLSDLVEVVRISLLFKHRL
jgi:hypothetical protein